MSRKAKQKVVFTMNVVAGGLRPATAIDEELLASYRIGSQVEVTLHQGKSNDQLKLFWGFLSFVIDATQCYPTKEAMAAALLTQFGYLASYTALMGGAVLTQPASIAEMEQSVFNTFCQSSFDFIEDEWGIDIATYKTFLRSKGPTR